MTELDKYRNHIERRRSKRIRYIKPKALKFFDWELIIMLGVIFTIGVVLVTL